MTPIILETVLGVVLVGVVGAILTPAVRKYPTGTTVVVVGGVLAVTGTAVKLWLL